MKREKQINFRVSEMENIILEKLVRESGLQQGEFLRRCVFDKEIINMEPLKELVPEMKRQGVNLNQVAKQLNSRGYVDYNKELRDTLNGVETTWQLLRQYLRMHQ